MHYDNIVDELKFRDETGERVLTNCSTIFLHGTLPFAGLCYNPGVLDHYVAIEGLAVVRKGSEYQWYCNDKEITEEVKGWLLSHNYTWPLTSEQNVEFMLVFG